MGCRTARNGDERQRLESKIINTIKEKRSNCMLPTNNNVCHFKVNNQLRISNLNIKKQIHFKTWRFGTINIRSGKEKDEGAKIYSICKTVTPGSFGYYETELYAKLSLRNLLCSLMFTNNPLS